MHININDVFYSQYSHQPVSAGIVAIFRVNTNCILVKRTSPWRLLEYWAKHVGYNIMNKIYYQCGRGTYYNEYKLLRIFFIIPKMCQSHGIYFVLNSGVNLLQASTWSMWPTEFWTSKCHDMGCSQVAVTQPILLPCNCHYCGLLRKILKFTLHINVQKALAQWLLSSQVLRRPDCASLGRLSKCMWWFFITVAVPAPESIIKWS
jgi:hypothetical protein